MRKRNIFQRLYLLHQYLIAQFGLRILPLHILKIQPGMFSKSVFQSQHFKIAEILKNE